VEEYGRVRQATVDSMIGRMRLACWISKATDTQNILILTALSQQNLLREHVSVFRLYVH
jgi:hypothetical protein